MNRLTQALDLAARIEPILKGHDPAVQGAALAQLLAIWVAGHNEEARVGLLDMHIVGVREMFPVVLKERDDAHKGQAGRSAH